MTFRHLGNSSIAAAALLGTAAAAAPRPVGASTSLHRCGQETCLMVVGHRSEAAAPVLIAGHAVVVQGGRRWRVAVPLPTVRQWSAPQARSITVAVAGPGGNETAAALPIGLLGHTTELAFLDVSAAH